MPQMMVTGGAGLVGSHVCDLLVEAGHSVLCVDNLSTGDARNIAHLLDTGRLMLRYHDIEQPLTADVQRIFNLACPASPVHYQTDPIRTLKTNILGAINLLDLARATGARILQASTSEVYGDPEVHPQREDYRGSVNTFGPRACYDEGKRCAETLFHDYHHSHGVDIRIARIFNTYGPRMSAGDGRVVSNFIIQALHGTPITIYGSGDQTRSFCYVGDMARGLVALMDSGPHMRRPCNLGNPVETTVVALADLIIALTGSRSPLVLKPLPKDDPVRRRPDISLARSELGWEPRVTLREGLEKTIAWFEAELMQDQRAPQLAV